ncbi:YqeG family HAD IIIA-type phosphatase [Francisella hispaniensis]|uniref:HAD family hydrolase n=1 Tax=Francisella hispaniensis FSC454 TaxID=1088883 RepID=A0AAC9NNF8_9GAMM|nr:HAD family hydrolase [Francisella hispaniensis]APD49691.1 HAD family hydrolase [Francisella hispaniensis FSC454]KYW87177.1 HAD family hydrolase [Francisella hispaniensis FSC454]
MLQRGLYTLKQMFKHRKKLCRLSQGYQIDSIVNLSTKLLRQQGINYLALDFDGVLASHGKSEMHPEVMIWLKDFVTEFPQERIFILSNKPTEARLKYFKVNFPKIRFIAGVAKKPYPDGLNKIIQVVGCQAKELALVDDRLLTGCLACLIAGCYPILVTKPYIDTDNYTKEEKFFKFLRYIEQKIFL